MRFTSIIVAGALAMFASAQDTTGTASATAVTTDAAQASTNACLNACDPADVDCRSICLGVPHPDAGQANATTECAAKCDQGDGSQSATDAFGACVDRCIADNFFTSGGTPQATAGSGSSGSTASGSSASATATSGSSGGSSSSTSGSGSSGTSSSSSESASASGSAADSIKVGMTGLGLLGFIAAAVAL